MPATFVNTSTGPLPSAVRTIWSTCDVGDHDGQPHPCRTGVLTQVLETPFIDVTCDDVPPFPEEAHRRGGPDP